ncbi:hypothetical protein QDK90_35800, partial [Streptomyces sp. 12257]|nr:hypothetical protein [Streptomyces sp. 12257]
MRDRDRRSWLRGAPPPGWVRVLPAVLLVGVCVATLVSPGPLDIGFLLGAIPPLAVLSYGPVATAVLGASVLAVGGEVGHVVEGEAVGLAVLRGRV